MPTDKRIQTCHFSARKTLLSIVLITASVAGPLTLSAQNLTVTGNLSVTGTTDSDGNNLTFGTQSSSYGAGFVYTDADTDTLTSHLNRSTASWLWTHGSATNAMRLNANHELVVYKSDGTTVGVTITPATNTLSLGGTTLYRDGSGGLATSSSLNVGGAFLATSFTSSGGSISGGASGLSLSAGGTNQNITLSPTGGGHTILNGNVGIGTNTPSHKLHVNGRILATELDINGGSIGEFRADGTNVRYGSLGDYTDAVVFSFSNAGIAIDGNNNSNSNFFSIYKNSYFRWGGTELFRVQEDGNVGIGTSAPGAKLDVSGDIKASGNLIEKSLVFTPSSAGWYRVVSTWAETDGGVMRIFNRGYENTRTDIEISYNIGGYGVGGSIQQIRHSSFNGGIIQYVRISSNGGGTVYVDLYVKSASSPQPISLFGYGPNFNGFLPAAIPVSSAGSTNVTVLEVGHGLRTTSDIASGSSITSRSYTLIDPNAPNPSGAVATSLTDTGGWESIDQHAGRDISVWSWKTGGPSKTIMQLKASKDDSGNPAYLALNNGSETTKVFLNTNGSSYLLGGNVGIGTTTPTAKIAIAGDMKISGPILTPAQGDLSMGSFTQGPAPTL